jgi:hypothetical protein
VSRDGCDVYAVDPRTQKRRPTAPRQVLCHDKKNMKFQRLTKFHSIDSDGRFGTLHKFVAMDKATAALEL